MPAVSARNRLLTTCPSVSAQSDDLRYENGFSKRDLLDFQNTRFFPVLSICICRPVLRSAAIRAKKRTPELR